MTNEDQAQELEALAAIMGEDMWTDVERAGSHAFYISPEGIDAETESVGSIVLVAELPEAYPAAAPSFSVCSLADPLWVSRFAHRGAPDLWLPTAQQLEALSAVASSSAQQHAESEPVLWDVVEAVREWLATHTLSAAPPPPAKDAGMSDLKAQLDGAELSEDDLELDEEDMDEEMIDAVREVLVLPRDKPLERKLDMAEGMKANSKAQRAALKEVWLALSHAQRKQMVASDGEDDSDDSESEADAAAAAAATATAAARGGGKKAKQQQKQAPLPPAAQRPCPRGHSLTAVNCKPADYKRLDGNEGNCDLCDVDFLYTQGGYHCDTCRNWDSCVACGSRPAAASKGKSSKGRKK